MGGAKKTLLSPQRLGEHGGKTPLIPICVHRSNKRAIQTLYNKGLKPLVIIDGILPV